MDNTVRLQYLEAMGIDVWVPRTFANQEHALAVIDHVDTFSSAELESTQSATWDSLQAEVANCTQCPLCKTRNQTVFGSGNKQADWMVIGEAPGQSEDQQGLPFVGNAGLLLTEMLRAIGLDRKDVFITNVVKCRPPGNREPKPDEVEACRSYLQQQQALIKPKIILAVGHIAAQTLLKTDAPLATLRGKVHALNDTPVVVIYHPAHLLRALSDKRNTWLDLQLAMQTYNNIKG